MLLTNKQTNPAKSITSLAEVITEISASRFLNGLKCWLGIGRVRRAKWEGKFPGTRMFFGYQGFIPGTRVPLRILRFQSFQSVERIEFSLSSFELYKLYNKNVRKEKRKTQKHKNNLWLWVEFCHLRPGLRLLPDA